MASYASVYTPSLSRRSLLAREQTRERKRRRDADEDDKNDDDDDEKGHSQPAAFPSSSPDSDGEDLPRAAYAIHKKDPFYIAGWPRAKPLPGANFPHAAAPTRKSGAAEPTLEDELATLNPPIYHVPKSTLTPRPESLRRRHLDNLTAILHRCMLKQDWNRAARAWGLILRTEIQGYGPDIRKHGRWLIGAEILMRRDQARGEEREDQPDRPRTRDSKILRDPDDAVSIPDEGFQLARQYYERLTLQYPHRQRTPHSVVSAKVIYPALFNIWVYEVQERSKRARRHPPASIELDPDDDKSPSNPTTIHARELADASSIAHRMDDLLLSPPYDTDPELLQLRAMIHLWCAGLHQILAETPDARGGGPASDEDDGTPDHGHDAEGSRDGHVKEARRERQRAARIFRKMLDAGMELQAGNRAWLEEEESTIDISRGEWMDGD